MYHTIYQNLDYYVTDDYYNKLTNKESYEIVNSLDYLNERPVFYFMYLKNGKPVKQMIAINFKKEIYPIAVVPPENVQIFYSGEHQKNPESIIIDSKYKFQINNNEVYFAKAKEGE